MLENTLRELGLTEAEVNVYLALLNIGPAVVQDISKRARTHRGYTYEVLNSLKIKGLVAYYLKGEKQFFQAAPPYSLLNMVKSRELSLQKIMPTLEHMFSRQGDKSRVEVFEGKEGLKAILEDMLHSDSEIIAYTTYVKLSVLLNHYLLNFTKRRVENGIKMRAIVEKSPETLELRKRNAKELRELRFYPENTDLSSGWFLYDNKVAIVSYGKYLVAILIEDPAICQAYKAMFQSLWKINKK